MDRFKRIWVENAIEITGSRNVFELMKYIDEGGIVQDGMVSEEDAMNFAEDYARDCADVDPTTCADCNIGTVPIDRGYICVSCNERYP